MKYKIAIVIPAFNEEKSVNKLYKQIIKSIATSKKISDYEIIFVNANSKDNTKKCIEKITNENKKVSLINNNKKYKADCLELGFKNVSKNIDLVFMMDADLQDDPKEFDKFISKIEEGYDLVSGYKKNRLDNIEKRTASKIYNQTINLLFGMHLHDHNCGFKCFRRKVIDELEINRDLHRFITVFVHKLGYKVSEIAVTHHKREYGKSKYGLSRYLIGFKDAAKVKFITTFNKKYKNKKKYE